jgi:hypothetical protein
VSGRLRDEGTRVLIERLAGDLRPVRRLARPMWRAALWLGLALLIGLGLATGVDPAAVAARIGAMPDMWLSVLGSLATAVTAAIAALMLALPDRDGRWALLPLPPAALWLVASGLGCLRRDAIGFLHPATLADATANCLPFILKMSAVLAVPFGFLVWRARPLRLGLVAWTGGLAVASAAASLLWLVHPFDASLADLLVHAAAIGLVMLLCRVVATLLPE